MPKEKKTEQELEDIMKEIEDYEKEMGENAEKTETGLLSEGSLKDIVKSIAKMADYLDDNKLVKEANMMDQIMTKVAEEIQTTLTRCCRHHRR